jgi:hypothetical protein
MTEKTDSSALGNSRGIWLMVGAMAAFATADALV